MDLLSRLSRVLDQGFIFGCICAVMWGLGDYWVRPISESGREKGRYPSMVYTRLFTMVVLAIAILCADFGLFPGNIHPKQFGISEVIWIAILAVCSVTAQFAIWRAFGIGKMAVVAPIVAASGAVTLVLALLHGDQISTLQLSGLVGTLIGVVLTSIELTTPLPDLVSTSWWSTRRRSVAIGPGALAAVVAALVWGFFLWAQTNVVPTLGPLWATQAVNLAAIPIVLLLAVPPARKLRTWLTATPEFNPFNFPKPAILVLIIGVALMYTLANVFYNAGIKSASPGVVAVVASFSTPITIALAWIFRHERLNIVQWVGVVLTILSLVLVAWSD